jgi:hypothetical protein
VVDRIAVAELGGNAECSLEIVPIDCREASEKAIALVLGCVVGEMLHLGADSRHAGLDSYAWSGGRCKDTSGTSRPRLWSHASVACAAST